MDACAQCGKQIYAHQSSVYDKRPIEDIGRIYHSACVEDARIARIAELETALRHVRGDIADGFPQTAINTINRVLGE